MILPPTASAATLRAGELAGLEVIRIIIEPTAAVLAYVVLVAPWAGLESLLVIWVPALLGIVAGVYYRRLSRKTGPPVSE
jgi:hypothetical protein